MSRRKMWIATIACAWVAATVVPAEAINEFLAYPDSVTVRRETTFETEAEAVAALASDDNTLFTVEPKKKDGSWRGVYDVRIPVPRVPDRLTWQFTGDAGNFQCRLKLFLFKWTESRWVKVMSESIGTTEALYTAATVRGRPFVMKNRVRGRVACGSKDDFAELHSERLRLIGEDLL